MNYYFYSKYSFIHSSQAWMRPQEPPPYTCGVQILIKTHTYAQTVVFCYIMFIIFLWVWQDCRVLYCTILYKLNININNNNIKNALIT